MKIDGAVFASRLKSLMESRNITNYQLAKELPCSKSSVANWLSGKAPNWSTLQLIADYFGVSLGYMVGKDDVLLLIAKKETPATKAGDGLSDAQRDLIQLVSRLTDSEISVLLKTAEGLIAARTPLGGRL